MKVTLEYIEADIAKMSEHRERLQAELNHTLGALQYAEAIREGLLAPEPAEVAASKPSVVK